MQIGLEPAGIRFRLEAQRVVRPAGDPVVDIGAEVAARGRSAPSSTSISTARNGASSTVMPHFSDRRDQEILVALALEHGGEQLDQRRPADRRLEVVPGAVGGDPHVEIAAKRRVPQVHRRRALFRLRLRAWLAIPSSAGLPLVCCLSFAIVDPTYCSLARPLALREPRTARRVCRKIAVFRRKCENAAVGIGIISRWHDYCLCMETERHRQSRNRSA